MLKALVPVDGSPNSLDAVAHVIKLVRDREPLELHLLNVQPGLTGDITTFVPRRVVTDFHREEGEKALAGARELLDRAAIAYTPHIAVGHPPAAIAHCARKLGCDKVIMGTHGYGTVRQLILGSVSHEAIHLLDPSIPVTLVKAGYGAAIDGASHG